MAHSVNVSDTLSLHPVSLDTANSNYPGTYYSTHVLDNAFTDASSSTRWAPYTNTGSNATTTIYLNFDCSEIPTGATINSISCQVKCGTQGTSYYGTRTVQMATGTTVKGSATTMSGSNSSPSTHTLTVGTWTAAELHNAKLKFVVQRGTSNTTTEATFSIYGATLSVSYTYSGTVYDVIASSSVDGVTVTPTSQDANPGDTVSIRIDGNSLDDLEITDNGNDISSQLVQHTIEPGGTEDTVLGTYTLVSGGFNGSGATFFQGRVGQGVNASTTTSNYYSSGSGTIAVFTYNLVFSDVPSNATITRLYCQVNGHAESTSNSNEYMCAALALGTADSTLISNELNFKSIGTSNSTQTIEATTLPTVAQLSNLKLRCRLGYYGGAINGATAYLQYTVPNSGGYYWTYTMANVSTDHTILIEEGGGVYIPPEEDPNETYWPITISSINADTDPDTGTHRVIEGSNQTITITPSDPQLTLALDNGNDITNQLVYIPPTNTYTVTTQVSGASYGFNLNNSTSYYTSTNAGVGNSAAVCRVNFDLETPCLVTIEYINYAQASYDYGLFGQIDTALGTTYTADSNVYRSCASSSYNLSTVQTVTYEINDGTHFIDIKYRKNNTTNSNNDNLQWKIASIEPIEANGDYTYTLTNVTQKHSLIFVFGDVTFYYVSSTGTTGARLFPDGQQVVLPGDSYKLVIIPDNTSSTLTVYDNGTNVTSSLEEIDGVDNNDNPIVNYIYTLNNIQTSHSITVQVGTAILSALYFRENDTWRQASKAYKKINGSWIELIDLTTVFDNQHYYKKG